MVMPAAAPAARSWPSEHYEPDRVPSACLRERLSPLLERVRALNLPPSPPMTEAERKRLRERLREHSDPEPERCAEVVHLDTDLTRRRARPLTRVELARLVIDAEEDDE
jgi:hypothetical protein